jgi:hypothetical protein
VAQEYRQAMKDCDLVNEIETIPPKILAEMKINQYDAETVPSFLAEEVIYYEQYEETLPPDEFNRTVAIAKLLKAYEGQMDTAESATDSLESGKDEESDGD